MTAGGSAKAAPALPKCPRGVDIAANVRAGRESAAAACAAALARIAETESEVHAWAHLDAEKALMQARAIDDAGPAGALAGVPVAVKDIFDTADQPTGERHTARCGTQAGYGRHGRATPARGRRAHPGQDGDHRARLRRRQRDPQPARARAHAGGVILGLGRDRGRRRRAARARQPDRRLGGAAGGVLRRLGHEAEFWGDPAHRGHAARADARPRRRARGLGRGRGARHRRALRRRRAGSGERRASPHPPRRSARPAARPAAPRVRARAGLGRGGAERGGGL